MQVIKQKKATYQKLSFLLVCIIGLMFIGGKSMAFGKVNLSSQMQGVLFNTGEPVANATVTRRVSWHWGNLDETESTTTDDKGTFSFPEKTAVSFTAKLLPHEPVIKQSVMFSVDGIDYEGWIYTKHNYDNRGEFQGKALIFTCELSEKPKYRKTYGVHGAFGICQID